MKNIEFLIVLENLIKEHGKEKDYQVRMNAKNDEEFETDYADLLLFKLNADNIHNAVFSTKAFLLKKQYLEDKEDFINKFAGKLI